jgi:hypothetical protein
MTTSSEGDRACDSAATPDELLQVAARMRQHALYFYGDPIAERLEEYADDLEARATRLARR